MNKNLIFACFRTLLIWTVFLIPVTANAQNYAMSLPGGSDGSTSNIDISGLNLTTLPYTIEMWIKPDGNQTDNAGLIYHRGTGNAGVQYSSGWQGSGKLRFMTNINGDYGTVTDGVSTGVWHYVGVVLTATTRTIYLDDKVYTQTINNSNYDFSTGKLYIGWDNSVANRTIKGLVDEIRIWNQARTSAELNANKLKVLSGTETGLVGYWNFDDQNLVHVTDLTGHGLHGIINGGTYAPSTVFDTMILSGSGLSQKSKEVNSPSLNNDVARLNVITVHSINPLSLTTLYLSANGTTSLTNISNVNVYYTGSDSTFSTAASIASLGKSPSDTKFAISCNQQLNEGLNYFWIAYDVAKNVTKGNLLDVECDSFVLAGIGTKTNVPTNPAPGGALTVNPDIYMPNVKLPVDVVTSLGQTPTGGANFVSFQQNAITTYNGYQYVTYWNNAYHVCAARKKLPVGSWEILEFTDYTVTAFRLADNHYSISIGICPNDGTIHLAFDHHGDNLHYRKSIVGLANKPTELSWSAASFGGVQGYLISGQPITQVTYPRFIIKPGGDLLYEYRYGTSGAGDSYLYEYSAANGSWTSIGKYIDGLTLNNNAYLNGIHYDQNGRLHASWVWRETPDALTNHDVCYMYSDNNGRTWMSHSGTQVGTAITDAVNSNTSGIKIWTIGQKRGLINQESQVVDSKGGIHILQSYLLDSDPNSTNFWNDRARAYLHHIYKDENGVWQSDVIDAVSVNRSQIAIDEGDNLYIVAPNYRIYYASSTEKWKKWTVFDLSESSSAINEGLIDRELLLNESVLSFVFAQTGGKIIVPHYLVDKSTPGKGTGLNVSVYGGSSFGSFLKQKLTSVNLTSSDLTYSGDSISARCLGMLETKYAEAYTLQFTTSGKANVWINNALVLNTGNVSVQTTFPIVLSLQPSHKYNVKIEAKYATNNVVTKLEWESDRQSRELVPLTALYGGLTNEVPDTIHSNIRTLATTLQIRCQPNPFLDNTVVNIDRQFAYKLFNAQGKVVREGEAANQLVIGESLGRGVYMLKVVQGGKSKTIKLIKI